MKLTVTIEKDGLNVGDLWHELNYEAIDWRDSGMDWVTEVNPNGMDKRTGATGAIVTWEVTN